MEIFFPRIPTCPKCGSAITNFEYDHLDNQTSSDEKICDVCGSYID